MSNPEQPQQYAMIQTTLSGCQIDIQDLPDGGKQLILVHPAGQVFIVPFSSDGARAVGAKLASSIKIASPSEMPKANRQQRRAKR